MKQTIDTYLDNTETMDIQVLSTLGITQEDVEALENIEGIEKVIPSYSQDVMIQTADKEYVAKVQSIEEINKVEIVEGRMPENANECVIDTEYLENENHKIGNTIFIDEKDGFNTQELTIVGTINSPLYLTRTKGTTNLGAGTIHYIIYVPKETFNLEVYTEAYIIAEQVKEISFFDKEYEEKIEKVKDEIEKISEERKDLRYEEVIGEANKELQEAENTLAEEKQKAEEEIQNAEKELEDGKRELEEGEQELNQNEQNAEREFQNAESLIEQAEAELTQRESELNQGKQAIIEQYGSIDNALTTLQTNQAQIETGLQQLNQSKTEYEGKIQDTEQLILSLQQQEQTPEIMAQIQQLQLALSGYTKAVESINNMITEQNTNLSAVKSGIEQIQALLAGETQIAEGKQELEDQKSELETTKRQTRNQIAEARAELEEGKKELEEGQKELEEGKKEADEKIAEAEKEIQNAKDEIAEIEEPEWYILDRDTNMGIASFKQDTDRIAKIGEVFPIVFFIVAALISLTSMTRMVEEQREKIGTLKALGYPKGEIALKYIIYAFSATVIGGVIGLAVGFYTIPRIIYDMYRMMYTTPELIIEFNLTYTFVGLGLAVACTCLATAYASYKELKEMPATLMRPKSPKLGKRVILEKIPFIWNKLKFTQKVTVRNIFRYKKRFLMTIIGIFGCTSMIIAGFGLRDSISSMIPSQYGEIFQYTMRTDMKEGEDVNQFIPTLGEKEEVLDSIAVNMQSIEITKDGNTEEPQLIVPKEVNRLSEFIKLKEKNKDEIFLLEKDYIFITEKLAKLLNVKEGDEVILKDADDNEVNAKVSHIVENYLMHYVYMSPETYEELFGETVDYNVILSKTVELSEEQEEEFAKDILDHNTNVSGVTFTSATANLYDDVMNNLSYVVVVLIVSAGLLAFVVLYNLSNVNISERIRELASIKVLGFYDGEVYRYVSRETVILTIIGILLGCLGGYLLNMYLIQTCELNETMFDTTVKLASYLYGIAITVFFTIIVNIFTYFALKKINMIEALKSVE